MLIFFNFLFLIKETAISKVKLMLTEGNANGLMFGMISLIGRFIRVKHHRRELGHLLITRSQKVITDYVGIIFLNSIIL